MENVANAPSDSFLPVISFLQGFDDALVRDILARAPQYSTTGEEATEVALEFIRRIVKEPNDLYRAELLSGFKSAKERIDKHFAGVKNPELSKDFVDEAYSRLGTFNAKVEPEVREILDLIRMLPSEEPYIAVVEKGADPEMLFVRVYNPGDERYPRLVLEAIGRFAQEQNGARRDGLLDDIRRNMEFMGSHFDEVKDYRPPDDRPDIMRPHNFVDEAHGLLNAAAGEPDVREVRDLIERFRRGAPQP